jgi:PAS domain S-box-containing protein
MSIVLSRSITAQIGVALLSVSTAGAISLALDDRSMVLPFALAVVVAACLGRVRCGLIATFLSAITIQYLSHGRDLVGIGVFPLIGAAISLIVDRLGRESDSNRADAEQVRGGEERLRVLVDSIRDYALCLLDADGRVVSWNTGAEQMFGYRRDDIIGRHFCCLYTDAAVKAGEPSQELELAQAVGRCERRDWHLRHDGGRLRAHLIFTAIHDDGGQLRGYSIVIRELIVDPTPRSLTGLMDEQRRGLQLALTNRT